MKDEGYPTPKGFFEKLHEGQTYLSVPNQTVLITNRGIEESEITQSSEEAFSDTASSLPVPFVLRSDSHFLSTPRSRSDLLWDEFFKERIACNESEEVAKLFPVDPGKTNSEVVSKHRFNSSKKKTASRHLRRKQILKKHRK